MAIANLLHARHRRNGKPGRPDDKAPPPRTPEVHVSRWPAILALLALGLLYWALAPEMRLGPPWLLLVLEVPVFAFLILARRVDLGITPHHARIVVLSLLTIATLLIAVSIEFLLSRLIVDKVRARPLLGSAAALWCSNVLVFALWYWELDQGGPHRRHLADCPAPELLFPQQSGPGIGPPNWKPAFIDYLFVAFTNATAFSPTDTLPLTPRIKVLMMIEATCSVLMVAVIAGRAINIL